MAKNINIQAIDNLSDNFRGYATLLRKIKQRVQLAQQRAIYAANEEMLRMYWDIGEMLQQSQDADGWGKKTLQRLSVDLKNNYSEIKGFSVRNMQCMIQFFNEYNQELTMVKSVDSSIAQPLVAQLGQYNFTLPIKHLGWAHNLILLQQVKRSPLAYPITNWDKPCRKTSVVAYPRLRKLRKNWNLITNEQN
jgi:hypothetical protein